MRKEAIMNTLEMYDEKRVRERTKDMHLTFPDIAGWLTGVQNDAQHALTAVHLRYCDECRASVEKVGHLASPDKRHWKRKDFFDCLVARIRVFFRDNN